MKLLLIHSDFIEYEVKDKAIKNPEETEVKNDRLEEALTAFTAVEKVDEKSPKNAVLKAVSEIEKTAEQLKIKNIMLYPYAHLSSDLANPKKAQDTDKVLQFEGVYRGWERTPVNVGLSQLGESVTLEEDEIRRVVRRGDGLVEWRSKRGDYRRRTLEWPVKDRKDWEQVKAAHLQADDPERFPDDWDAYVHAFREITQADFA